MVHLECFSIQDSDWEEVQNGDATPHDIVYSASVPSNANPSVEHLNAMAKVFDEVYISKKFFLCV